jgi:hypothetical protein
MKKISNDNKITKVKVLIKSEYINNFKETISLSTYINNLMKIQKLSQNDLNFNDVNNIINLLKKSQFEKIT